MTEIIQIAQAGLHPWNGIEIAPPPVYRYAIIKHRWRESTPPLLNPPDTCPFQDTPAGDNKGTPVPISQSWFDHIEAISPADGFKWITSVGNMIFNTPANPSLAELIGCGGNYVGFDFETATHVRAISYNWQMDARTLNPEIDNWRNKPYLYLKACTISESGIVRNVGAGLDAYWVMLAKTEIWINKKFLEIFPPNDYYFVNGLIYADGKPYPHETKNVVLPL